MEGVFENVNLVIAPKEKKKTALGFTNLLKFKASNFLLIVFIKSRRLANSFFLTDKKKNRK